MKTLNLIIGTVLIALFVCEMQSRQYVGALVSATLGCLNLYAFVADIKRS